MYPQAPLETLFALQRTYYSSVAALAWLIFDIVITLDQEVEFIWKARWTFPKCLYLVTRYYGLFNLVFYTRVALSPTVSVNYCKTWVWFDAFSNTTFYTAAVTLLFVLRIYALYERRRSMLIFLLTVAFLESGIASIISVITLRSLKFVERPLGQPILGCLVLSVPRLTLVSWIMYLVIACGFYVLTMCKLARSMNLAHWFNIKLIFSRAPTYPLMTVFFLDGNLFFGVTFLVILLNTVVDLLGGPLRALGGPWLSAVYTVAGSRLVLNLRTKNATPEPTFDMYSFSTQITQPHSGEPSGFETNPILLQGTGRDETFVARQVLHDDRAPES